MTTTDAPSDAPTEAATDAGATDPGRPADRQDGTEARQMALRIARREPIAYARCWAGWVAFHTLPIVGGLALREVLDNLPAADGDVVWLALAAVAGLELGRWALFLVNVVQWHGCMAFWASLPRVNILQSLVKARGPVAGRLPGSSGEAVSRFRDDTFNVAMVLDVWVDISGTVLASLLALAAMVAVDVRVTIAVALPVLVSLAICRWLGTRLRAWRRREREATAAVTGFIGDAFGAIGTVKSSGARAAVARRFAELGDARAEAARVDQVATQMLQTLSACVGDLGTGLVLLLLVPALARGDATVGDVGLYTTAVVVVSWLPRWAARYSATLRQADVSVERLADLLPDGRPEGLTAATSLPLRHGPGPFPPTPVGAGAADRLVRLEVRRLSVAYEEAHDAALPEGAGTDPLDVRDDFGGIGDGDDGRDPVRSAEYLEAPAPAMASAVEEPDGAAPAVVPGVDGDGLPAVARSVDSRAGGGDSGGIDGVDLVVERGTMTVVTGPVGSGKSTLLRAVLGLVGHRSGAVVWNGEVLDDPGQVLVPPRVAYVAQTPRLFSEPLRDAILLGVEPAGLAEAVHLACLDDDVARMPEGLATVVGARGVRLSGGQVQRTAAARALVRRPELLVVDDLSSALDVQTEARLWDQLLDPHGRRHTAFLVVSHRPAVLERADRVVVLAGGRSVPGDRGASDPAGRRPVG
jgi:ATP-binding cassette subfamily B protein